MRDDDARLPEDDSGFVIDDAGVRVPCTADTDCGRCQRCDVGFCQRATFVELGLDRRNSCALDERGDVWCWGRNDYEIVDASLSNGAITARPRRRPDLTGVAKIAVGWGVTYALLTSGTLLSRGTLGGSVNESSLPLKLVVADSFNACALTTGGAIYCSGNNQYAQLGRGTSSASSSPQPLGEFVPPTAGWQRVETGRTTCAIDASDRLYCVGGNNFGQLARGTLSSFETGLAQVGASADWAEIAVGENNVCAIRRNGTLWCWGEHPTTSAARSSPVQIGADTDWSAVDCNDSCACAVKAGTTLWCACGFSRVTEAVGAPRITDWTPLSVAVDPGTRPEIGGDHACVRQNGAWVCWGDNTIGAVGVDDLAVVGPTPLCE